MPIFEYACTKCGHEFEALTRSSSQPECPQCHAVELDKKLSVFATSSSQTQAPAAAAGPCGGCGHPGGPGSCAMANAYADS
jgi:putative FmdB family regulatory protein